MTIAAYRNYPELLEILLCVPGINVNLETSAAALRSDWTDRGNFTPLMIACIEANYGIVNTLLAEKEIDIAFKDNKGNSVLHYAAANCPSSIELLAKVPGLDWNEKNDHGETPLFDGLRGGRDEVVETIISLPNIHYNVKSITGQTLAATCVTSETRNNLKCLELLSGVDEIDWNIPDKNGEKLIMWCVKNKKFQKFKILLKCLVFDLNIQEVILDKIIDGLFQHFENFDIVYHLTENNADTNTFNCMLSVAAMVGHLTAVKSLVQHGSTDVNKRDKSDNTPIDYAVDGGHLDVARFLIESGANGSVESVAAKIFISSCQQNNPNTVAECMDLGVNVNMKTDDGIWSGKKLLLKFEIT